MAIDVVTQLKLQDKLNEIADLFKIPKLTLVVRNSENVEKDSVVLTNDTFNWAKKCIDWAEKQGEPHDE